MKKKRKVMIQIEPYLLKEDMKNQSFAMGETPTCLLKIACLVTSQLFFFVDEIDGLNKVDTLFSPLCTKRPKQSDTLFWHQFQKGRTIVKNNWLRSDQTRVLSFHTKICIFLVFRQKIQFSLWRVKKSQIVF